MVHVRLQVVCWFVERSSDSCGLLPGRLCRRQIRVISASDTSSNTTRGLIEAQPTTVCAVRVLEMANEPDEDAWPVKGIVAENPSKKMFKIEWDGLDLATGEPWEPTWEPYECVSSSLRGEWEAKKRAKEDRERRKEEKRRLQVSSSEKGRRTRVWAEQTASLSPQALDIQRQQRQDARRAASYDSDSRHSSRSLSRSRSRSTGIVQAHRAQHRGGSASSSGSQPLRQPRQQKKLDVPASVFPQPEDDIPAAVQPTRKRKRVSQADSESSYRPTQATHTQSTENTRDTLYSSNISTNSVNALKSTQERVADKTVRRKSAPAGDEIGVGNGRAKAPRRSLPAHSNELEENTEEHYDDAGWSDAEPMRVDPRAGKKTLRRGVQTTNRRVEVEVPVKSKRTRRKSRSPPHYTIVVQEDDVELQHRSQAGGQEAVEGDADEGLSDQDFEAEEEPEEQPEEEPEDEAEPQLDPEHHPEAQAEYQRQEEPEAESSQQPRIMQSFGHAISSSDEDAGRVVVQSASKRRRTSAGAPQLPESLRYNGTSRSEYASTSRQDALSTLAKRKSARAVGSDSGHQTDEPPDAMLTPPLARAASKPKKVAAKPKKARRPHSGQSDSGVAGPSGLPNFRKKNRSSIDAEEDISLIDQRTSRRSFEPPDGLDANGWPLHMAKRNDGLPGGAEHEGQEENSTHIVPDSQSLQLHEQYGFEPHNGRNGNEDDDVRTVVRHAKLSKGTCRQSADPPGSRFVLAITEKPLKKVQPPEPTVFKPYLRQQVASSADAIEQFSSQVQDASDDESIAAASRGAARQAIQQAAAASRASGVRRGQFPPHEATIVASAEGAAGQTEQQAMDNDVEMAYNEFNQLLSEYQVTQDSIVANSEEAPDLHAGDNLSNGALPALPQNGVGPAAPAVPAVVVPKEPSLPQREQAAQLPAAPEVVERKVSNRELGKLIKSSALAADTKDELAILLEAPDYYKMSGRGSTSIITLF